MPRQITKNERYELESLLYELDYQGFVVVPLRKLFRLLDKGNRAAGTWRALLDVWEEIEGNPDEIHGCELQNEMFLLTSKRTVPLKKMAEF